MKRGLNPDAKFLRICRTNQAFAKAMLGKPINQITKIAFEITVIGSSS